MPEIRREIAQNELEESFRPFSEIYEGSSWIYEKLQILKKKHEETYLHSLRVGFLMSEAAEFLYLSQKEKVVLTKTALLHDVGKLHVPDYILNSKFPTLPPAEREIMETHVRYGVLEVRAHNLVLSQILAAHHEFQENPYPRKRKRLKNAHLRPFQKLLAMCDHIDALGSVRGYKEKWPPEAIESFLKPVFGQDASLLRFAIGSKLRIV